MEESKLVMLGDVEIRIDRQAADSYRILCTEFQLDSTYEKVWDGLQELSACFQFIDTYRTWYPVVPMYDNGLTGFLIPNFKGEFVTSNAKDINEALVAARAKLTELCDECTVAPEPFSILDFDVHKTVIALPYDESGWGRGERSSIFPPF